MIITPQIDVLSLEEIDRIYNGIITLCSDFGIKIESDRILKQVEANGAAVDMNRQVALFPQELVESLFQGNRDSGARNNGAAKKELERHGFTIRANAEVYEGYYLEPESGNFVRWNLDCFLDYLKLVQNLDNIGDLHMLGCPVYGPLKLQPLYSRLLGWKYGFDVGGSIWDTRLCPVILRMCETMAEAYNKEVTEYFRGTVYIRSPFCLGSVEAEHFLFFYDHGLEVRIGQLSSVGATAPITLAGSLIEFFAEQVMIELITRSFFTKERFSMGVGLSVLDMSTGCFQYGRPEAPLLNMAGAHFARHFGLEFHGQCGLSDAKVPGYESAAQKLNSSLLTALSCGTGSIVAGLLGVDEINSPIQLILDNEMAGFLKRIGKGFDINEETSAMQEIMSVGHGGGFLSTEFTAHHFKHELWQPSLWSREMYNTWVGHGSRSAIDGALSEYKRIMDVPGPDVLLSEDVEQNLLSIVESVQL